MPTPRQPETRPTRSSATRQDSDRKQDTKHRDDVEIGEPVPDDKQTTRADDRSTRNPARQMRGQQGETGEDEDLPADDGGIGQQGETGEDEDLPADDGGIESPGTARRN